MSEDTENVYDMTEEDPDGFDLVEDVSGGASSIKCQTASERDP